jgi:uncharacterized Zn finger protein (UPF0148 family)
MTLLRCPRCSYNHHSKSGEPVCAPCRYEARRPPRKARRAVANTPRAGM